MMRTTIPTLLITSVFFFHSVELSSHGASSSADPGQVLPKQVDDPKQLLFDNEDFIKSSVTLFTKKTKNRQLVPLKEGDEFAFYGYTWKIPDDLNAPIDEKTWVRFEVPPEKWLEEVQGANTRNRKWINDEAQMHYNEYYANKRRKQEMEQAQLMGQHMSHHMAHSSGSSHDLSNQQWVQPTPPNAGFDQAHQHLMEQQLFNRFNQDHVIRQSQALNHHTAALSGSSNDPRYHNWAPHTIQNTNLEQQHRNMMVQQQFNAVNPPHMNFHVPMDPLVDGNTLPLPPQQFDLDPDHNIEHQQGITSSPHFPANQGFTHHPGNWPVPVPYYGYPSGAPAEPYPSGIPGSQWIPHAMNSEGGSSQPGNLRISTRRQAGTSSNPLGSQTSRITRPKPTKPRIHFHGEI